MSCDVTMSVLRDLSLGKVAFSDHNCCSLKFGAKTMLMVVGNQYISDCNLPAIKIN